MATKKDETIIEILPIDIRFAEINIVGDTPLIVHKWSEKAKREMLEKQMKVAKTKGKDAKSPVADFIDSLYWLEGEPQEKTEKGFNTAVGGAKFGFPATAFKASAVAAGFRAGVLKNKVIANGAFHIMGEFVEINGTPQMREDMVRVGMGTADIRYRGEFPAWSTTVTIRYNASVLTLDQIVNLFNLGGFACGVGEWRPEKGGTNGMYHIA